MEELYPDWVAACRRIVRAAKARKGVRLSVEEVRQAALDVANWECVQNAELWEAKDERQILLARRLCAQESEVWEEITEAYRNQYLAEARALIEKERSE